MPHSKNFRRSRSTYAGTGYNLKSDYTINWSVYCTLNILKHLNMIDRELVLPKRQIMVSNY